MDAIEMRLACLQLADGDINRAREFLDFAMGAKPLVPPVKPFVGPTVAYPALGPDSQPD